MEQVLFPVLVFLLKTLIVLLFLGFFVFLIAMIANSQKASKKGLSIRALHKDFQELVDALRNQMWDKDTLKKFKKEQEKIAKLNKKEKKDQRPQTSYLLEFKGDMRAHQVENLREEVNSILAIAKEGDEVIIKIHSPGGAVTGYGLAASQLERLKVAKLQVTACIDEVAASGGYMMACVAHKIHCAPFAIVGSIGVIVPVPNFNKLLKKFDIDYNEYTAGEYKRTVSYLAPNDEKGEGKLKEQLEETHKLFKDMVHRNRPHLDIEKIATGEYWHGVQALPLGLVDELGTSDDLILQRVRSGAVFLIEHQGKKKLAEKMGEFFQSQILKIFFRQNNL